MTVTSLGIELNQASGVYTDPVAPHTQYTNEALDWTKAIDLNEADSSFHASSVQITTPTPTGPVTETIGFTDAELRASGQVSVDLFDGFITGDVGFSLELNDGRRQARPSTTLTGASLTELSLTVTNLDDRRQAASGSRSRAAGSRSCPSRPTTRTAPLVARHPGRPHRRLVHRRPGAHVHGRHADASG